MAFRLESVTLSERSCLKGLRNDAVAVERWYGRFDGLAVKYMKCLRLECTDVRHHHKLLTGVRESLKYERLDFYSSQNSRIPEAHGL